MYEYGSVDSEHIPTITEMGWGEPPEYYPSCSCGWRGITIDTYPQEHFNPLPELKPLIEQYGIEQVLREPYRMLGQKDDALKQVLIHIDYNPELDVAYSLHKFNEIFEKYSDKVKAQEYKQAFNLLKRLTRLNQGLLNAEHRAEVFKNHNLTIPELNTELHSKVKRITEDSYPLTAKQEN